MELSAIDFRNGEESVGLFRSERQSLPPVPRPGDLVCLSKPLGRQTWRVLDKPHRFVFTESNVVIEIEVEAV